MLNEIQKAYISKQLKISECAAQAVLLFDLHTRKLLSEETTKQELTKVRDKLLPLVGEGEETQQINLFIKAI